MNMSPEEEAAYDDFVAYTEAAAFAADADLGIALAHIRALWCTLYEVPLPSNLALGPDFDSMLDRFRRAVGSLLSRTTHRPPGDPPHFFFFFFFFFWNSVYCPSYIKL
jgi:hypothetical protein